MSETVQVVPDLPVKSTSVLKKVAKRTLIASAVLGVAALAYVKINANKTETENTETPSA